MSCQTQDNKPTSSLPTRLVLKGLNSKVGREQKDTDVEYERRLLGKEEFVLTLIPQKFRGPPGAALIILVNAMFTTKQL